MFLNPAGIEATSRPLLGVSEVAGQISGIVASLQMHADLTGDTAGSSRYDVDVQSIYFASLLLAVENDTGGTRNRRELLDALATVSEVVAELQELLRHW